MSRDKTAVFSRLPGGLEPLPEAWQSHNTFERLSERFTAALLAAKGESHRAGTFKEAEQLLNRLLLEMGAGSLVMNREPPLDRLELDTRLSVTTPVDPEGASDAGNMAAWRKACARADAGITGVDAALAETGSLVLSSGPGRSRMVSLLPPVHIALVPASKLTTDIFTWLKMRRTAWPANTVLISGPSKTGDIEQTLAVGVHGPGRLISILYEDAS